MTSLATAEHPAAWDEMSLRDRAAFAWEAARKLEVSSAIDSLRAQLFRQLKLRRDEIEFDPDYFDDEVYPHLRIAAFAQNITFCLTRDREAAVFAWQCAEQHCDQRWRAPLGKKSGDYRTLGRVLALAEREERIRPHCRAHKKKGEPL